MTSFIIGLIVTAGVIIFAELFRKIDLKFYASLNLAVIPFIYIGFSVDPHSLAVTAPGAALFLLFSYLGYKRSYLFTVVGLILHGLWDVIFHHVSSVAPHGYDIFCITIDILLAGYFYLKLRPRKHQNHSQKQYKPARV
jgi:hypothetical protein